MKRLNAPKHWLLGKMEGIWAPKVGSQSLSFSICCFYACPVHTCAVPPWRRAASDSRQGLHPKQHCKKTGRCSTISGCAIMRCRESGTHLLYSSSEGPRDRASTWGHNNAVTVSHADFASTSAAWTTGRSTLAACLQMHQAKRPIEKSATNGSSTFAMTGGEMDGQHAGTRHRLSFSARGGASVHDATNHVPV